jgi:glycolate oxidase FAD binding subunit
MIDMQATLQEFAQRIRAAAQNQTPLRFRGGGSKDFYGQSLRGDVLDTRAYHGVLSYEPSELVMTVRAGTSLVEVEQMLAQKGQCLAFEPPHLGPNATVGGMVAAGLAGPSRAAVGTVRDFVLGLRLLNGKGEDLTFGGQVMKNVAGYDVSRLLAGSMGQLALITEVSLKVLPVAPGEATLACEGVSQQLALDLLNRWGGQPLPLNASAWVENTLYLRLRGAIAAVESAIQKMSADVQALGAQASRMGDQAQADWKASAEQTLPFFAQAPSADACLWRLSVPQTTPDLSSLGVDEATYIEWHGAQRWIWAPAARADFLRSVTHQVGGHATLFRTSVLHGEADKSVGVFTPLDAVQQRIQRELKKQFDPSGVFNLGRV